MTKTDIVKELATENEITQDKANEILNSFIDIITKGLKEDNVVQITGFGTYRLKYVEAREGHNPKNVDEKIQIPARNQVSFSAGKQLKEAVNTKKSSSKKIIKKKK